MARQQGISIRPPREGDWPRVLELANGAVGHVAEAPPQDEWLSQRMAFDGDQQHFVAEEGDGVVVGYGAVERRHDEPEGTFRVFVVTSWTDSVEVAEVLYEVASAELTNLGARRAWLREYASDQLLIEFARAKGFEVAEEYERDGVQLVTLAKDLSASDRPSGASDR